MYLNVFCVWLVPLFDWSIEELPLPKPKAISKVFVFDLENGFLSYSLAFKA